MNYYTNKTEIVSLEEKLPSEGYEIVKTFAELTGKNWLLFNSKQAAFYKANPGASAEEVFNMKLNVYVPSFDELKSQKIAETDQADKAASVFYVNNVPMWIDKELRNSLLNVTLPALKEAKIETTKLWYEGIPPVPIEVSVEMLLHLIPQLELYAKAVYDNTQTLKVAVYNAETEETLNVIDLTGYPEHLKFTI